MQDKPGWPPYLAIETHPAAHLPPRPGIKTVRRLADTCPRCRCMHLTVEAAQACRSMANSREQP